MERIKLTDNRVSGPVVVALGNFDGLHLGHRELIERAVGEARRRGGRSIVYTFDRHPENVLTGRTVTPYLMTREQKIARLREFGVDEVCFEHFTRAFADMSPAEFVESVLVDALGAACAVVGFNYHFGSRGSGDAAALRQLCAAHGMDCEIVDGLTRDGIVISSSHIRTLILAGDVAGANELLGYPFTLTGPVLHGKKLGRTLGAPTINQRFHEGSITPAYGVYVTTAEIGGALYRGVTNVGIRPTVEDTQQLNAETYVMDFEREIYGESVTVRFLEAIRPERRFASIEALREQLMRDIETARQYFAKNAL